jgi:cytoskeletal protein CcmA (bactofilin family)
MSLACNLYIDGEFEGAIQSNKEINIGKHGHVKGDIDTKRLIVQGYIDGCINSEIVEIKANGRVNGTIEAGELIIEAKGIFEGRSVVKSSSSVTANTVLDPMILENTKKKALKKEKEKI